MLPIRCLVACLNRNQTTLVRGEKKRHFVAVDLAGSERAKRTGVEAGSTGQAEAISINKSFLTLFKCFKAMT